jgi:transposase-like protein
VNTTDIETTGNNRPTDTQPPAAHIPLASSSSAAGAPADAASIDSRAPEAATSPAIEGGTSSSASTPADGRRKARAAIARTAPARFVPPRCPYETCGAHTPAAAGERPYAFVRCGTFVRRGDGLRVQRFRCCTCGHSYSTQTFRLDYRLRRLDTIVPTYKALFSKNTIRKTARNLGVDRAHVGRRFRRFAVHGKAHHEHRLALLASQGGRGTAFQFDELETYEAHRKLKPVTACVLIEQHTGFLVSIAVGALAPRGRRTQAEERTLAAHESKEGRRRSESWKTVLATVAAIARLAPRSGQVRVATDCKASYATALAKWLGRRVVHARYSGRAERGVRCPLFPINHTLARLRDLTSRLVRQTWGASKLRSRLGWHLDALIAFRNYVDGWRSEPAVRRHTSAGAEFGAASRKFSAEEFLTWADPHCQAI